MGRAVATQAGLPSEAPASGRNACANASRQREDEGQLADFRDHRFTPPPWPAKFSLAIGCPACLRASAASGGM